MTASQTTFITRKGFDIQANNVDVAGDLTVAGTTTQTGALAITGALTVTGLISANGGTKELYSEVGANGAITQKSGVIAINKAGVCALTIADPTDVTDDGKILRIIAYTASAHTVDNSAGSGFNIGGAGSDIGTFGGAIGDNMTIVASNGKWLVLSKVNVTLA